MSDESVLTAAFASTKLATLGFNPLILQHTFLELDLSKQNFEDIDCIVNFPHVMNLDISENKLCTLQALSSLPCLTQLNARFNKVSDVLKFAPPHCNSEHSWESGHLAAGSMLTHANLNNNMIKIIRDLQEHQFLECLLLSSNQISTISGLSKLRFLKTLDLSNNQLTSICGLDDLPLRELNLSGNQLTSLEGLSRLPHLTSLSVADNLIESLSPLQSISTLSYVDLTGNKIQHIRQTEFLKDMVWLHVLLLNQNPCWKKELYRLRILYRLPTIKRLDMTNVSEEEKIRAFNLYRSSGGDLQLREQVHSHYIVDEPFVDHSPDQHSLRGWVDDEMHVDISSMSPNLDADSAPRVLEML